MEKGDKKTVVALMYDFDKTLIPRSMQEYTFIPSLGLTSEEFWQMTMKLSQTEQMDSVLAYMYLMLREARRAKIAVRRENFISLGAAIKFFDGLPGWFSRINKHAAKSGLEVRHYVISSGLKEIIEGCDIYDCFDRVFACEFHYDENGVADFPKHVVNFTGKTQFLFRINKGAMDVSDDFEINREIPQNERNIPWSNMIYIGDGPTDIPCMKLVKSNGGTSIAIYNDDGAAARDLLAQGRVDLTERADYSEGSGLDEYIKLLLDKIAVCSKQKQKTKKDA